MDLQRSPEVFQITKVFAYKRPPLFELTRIKDSGEKEVLPGRYYSSQVNLNLFLGSKLRKSAFLAPASGETDAGEDL